jgi:hypothetical protein
MLAYVLNKQGEALMPCPMARARQLLKLGKAKVVSREPLTIKLLYGSSGYKQEVIVSCDSGSKTTAFAAIANGKVIYLSEVKLRQDIHKNTEQKKSYKRNRKGRKTGYRQPRFDNRRRDGWLTPTLRSKVNSHKREFAFIEKRLPESRKIIEIASFDIHKIVNPEVDKKPHLYQKGPQKCFYNVKQFVLHRDKYTCQECHAKKTSFHVHHIVFRRNGGTDSPDNLITLCSSCHSSLHAQDEAQLQSKKLSKKLQRNTRDATHISTISAILKKELKFEETYGYETKFKRERLDLPKTHYNDAICVGLKDGEIPKLYPYLLRKIHIACGDYQLRKGHRSEQEIPTGKIMGIKKFDKVKANGVVGFVKGRMSTGYAILMDIDGKKIEIKPIPKLETLQRIAARKSCLTNLTHIENLQLDTISSSSLNTENKSSQIAKSALR